MITRILRPVAAPLWWEAAAASIEAILRRIRNAALLRDGSQPMTGPLTFTPSASVTPAENGQVTFELTSNTLLTVKAKGSDGTVRSGTITLS